MNASWPSYKKQKKQQGGGSNTECTRMLSSSGCCNNPDELNLDYTILQYQYAAVLILAGMITSGHFNQFPSAKFDVLIII